MGKIFFAADMKTLVLKTINEAHDCTDIANDLNRIQKTIAFGTDEEAKRLDQELQKKYPAIITMLQFANSLPKQPSQYSAIPSNESSSKENLLQDYYGILCDTAIKKGFKESISDCIDRVEGS